MPGLTILMEDLFLRRQGIPGLFSDTGFSARQLMTPVVSLALFTFCILTPGIARADGGGPLLLIISGLAFLYGGILIVLVEWLIYVRCARIEKARALWDSLIVNAVSTVTVGFGLPLAVAAVSGIAGIALPRSIGSYAAALGTWIYEGASFPKLTFVSTAFWWAITFFVTVYVEKQVLQKLWRRRQFSPVISAAALSWKSNLATYSGLLVVIVGTIVWENYHG